MIVDESENIFKIIVGLIQFDEDGIADISDADERIKGADLPEGLYDLESIEEIGGESGQTLPPITFQISGYVWGELSVVEVFGERKLKFRTILKDFKSSAEIASKIINALSFDKDGYLDVDKAEEVLSESGLFHDLFKYTTIQKLIKEGYKFFYVDENKVKTNLFLEEVNGKTMLKKEVLIPVEPKKLDEEQVKNEIKNALLKNLFNTQSDRMTLSALGCELSDKGYRFPKSNPIKSFINRFPDLFALITSNGIDYCVLKTTIPTPPPPSPVCQPDTVYSLGKIFAIDDKNEFLSQLVKLAKEDETWMYLENSSSPFRFLSSKLDFRMAYGIKHIDSKILKSDFFTGTLDTGLYTEDNKRILMRFVRNHCPDKDRPQPWLFKSFEFE